MTDWIERDYLIRKFEDTGPPAVSEMGKGYDLGIAAALRVVKSSPAVNRWIPCSNRMPENRENVIFTINRGSPMIGCGYRIHNVRGELLARWFDKLSGLNFSDYDVTAWMPMPDAYEPPEVGECNGTESN